eukprot:14802842-Alexandrium_andersonii.AAC.1
MAVLTSALLCGLLQTPAGRHAVPARDPEVKAHCLPNILTSSRAYCTAAGVCVDMAAAHTV